MQNIVDQVIRSAFRDLIEMEQETGNIKLIYPQLRNGQKRHSEQEFKQLFIDHFCRTAEGMKYSVETPTLNSYSFKKREKPDTNEKGRSGNIDLCIHQYAGNEWKRRHLVEFKAHNVPESQIEKDLLKLSARFDGDQLNKVNYFVHLIYTADPKTLDNLKEKYDRLKSAINRPEQKQITVYLLFVSGVKNVHLSPGYYVFDIFEGIDVQDYKDMKQA
ncbi:MAG TPA: hypothetical protein H9814_02925 [Candidatus Bacteroides merdigallinarum]|uniref:Restriction endonuclease n=1 Tax=Candidatus Bacteroides merdigallinarum TaxID=2838473 RepID=A0A9D2E813_9BACE|nr:hypothetical protein [Candidatus Bacteroides merdigallinarum]